MPLHVALSTSSGVPIYEQIERRVRAAILSGELSEGEALPSIRGLARDLQISVITTSRAYSDLAQQGYISNVPGKGSFVAPRNTELMREQVLRQIEGHLYDAADMARLGGVDDAELHTMLDLVLGLGADDQETSHE